MKLNFYLVDKISMLSPPIFIRPTLNLLGCFHCASAKTLINKSMSDEVKSTRGRKRILTDSGRKRNRQGVQANYNKSRINIGSEIVRWNELKDVLQKKSHAEVAKVLLDW